MQNVIFLVVQLIAIAALSMRVSNDLFLFPLFRNLVALVVEDHFADLVGDNPAVVAG